MGLPSDLGSFITALYAGTGKGVSDGSYQKDLDFFSAGWILKVGELVPPDAPYDVVIA